MYKRVFVLVFCFILFTAKISFAEDTWVPVLLYHHILSDEENTTQKDNGAVVSLENFEKQMKYLYDNGFNTIGLKDLQDFLYQDKDLPEKPIMIHFDDGYYSNILRAYPVLKKYGFKANIFLITSYISNTQNDFNPDTFTFIATESMADTKDVFEYASHSHNLHKLSDDNINTRLIKANTEEIKDDILTSFEILDYKHAFAYPLGQYNDEVIKALSESGIYLGFTVNPGYVAQGDNGMMLNRFIIYNSTNMKEFKKIVENNYYD